MSRRDRGAVPPSGGQLERVLEAFVALGKRREPPTVQAVFAFVPRCTDPADRAAARQHTEGRDDLRALSEVAICDPGERAFRVGSDQHHRSRAIYSRESLRAQLLRDPGGSLQLRADDLGRNGRSPSAIARVHHALGLIEQDRVRRHTMTLRERAPLRAPTRVEPGRVDHGRQSAVSSR